MTLPKHLALPLSLALANVFATAPVLADCAPDPVANGGTVDCTGSDVDGFVSASDDITLNVAGAASVIRFSRSTSPDSR